jgi:hypothetical protein
MPHPLPSQEEGARAARWSAPRWLRAIEGDGMPPARVAEESPNAQLVRAAGVNCLTRLTRCHALNGVSR